MIPFLEGRLKGGATCQGLMVQRKDTPNAKKTFDNNNPLTVAASIPVGPSSFTQSPDLDNKNIYGE